MITAIEDILNQARAVASEQSNRIASEMSSAYDAVNAAATRFNDRMKLARAKLDEASQIQADAVREHDSALSQTGAVLLSIVQQLSEGRMVTGSDQPAPKRPRLVNSKAAEQ